MTAVHFIPGYDPATSGADEFDVQITCRDCLANRVSNVMTLSKATNAPTAELLDGNACILGHGDGNWNVELGWVGRWNDDDADDADDDTIEVYE